MKNLIVSAFTALVAIMSVAPSASAGSYYGYEHSGYTYKYKKYRHCYWKKVKWYDDYGYIHYKRIKVCDY